MDIDESQTASRQGVAIDKVEYFVILCAQGFRKRVEQGQDVASVSDPAASQFAENERVRHDLAFVEKIAQPLRARAQMIDPD